MQSGFCESESTYAKRGRKVLAFLLAGVGIAILGLGSLQCGREGEQTDQAQAPPRVAPEPAPVVVAQTPRPAPEPMAPPVPEPAPPITPRAVTFDEGEALYASREYERAAEVFAAYAQDHPRNPWGHYMCGLAHLKAGSSGLAETGFMEALKLDPRHFKARVNYARLLIAEDRLTEAEFQAQRAIEIDSTANVAHRVMGRILHAQGETEKAIAAYKTALTYNDHDVWSMNNLGLLRIQEGRYGDALMPLARAVQLRDDVAMFHNNLGAALEKRGAYRAAEEAYRHAATRVPPSEKAAVSRARVAALAEDMAGTQINLAVMARRFTEELHGVLQTASSPAPAESISITADLESPAPAPPLASDLGTTPPPTQR